MVRNICWLLLISISCQAATQVTVPPLPDGLILVWQGTKSAGCQRLVEAFLSELRSLASDRTIQLEARQPASPNSRAFAMQCDGPENSPRSLMVRQGEQAMTMHYLAKAGGFDATDWLPFQQKFLRPATEQISLAPEPALKPEEAPLPLAEPAPQSTANTASDSILKKWWFWALVGGAGAGVYGLTQVGQHDSNSMNVEIR